MYVYIYIYICAASLPTKSFVHMEILSFILFICLLSSVTSGKNVCPDTSCSHKGFTIRFPFRLAQQPQNCGYPGFDVRCSDQGRSILNLGYSGDFFVRDINYFTQEVLLYDPNKCLPNRLLNLNLSSTPFRATYYQNYTFLSCPSEFVTSKFNAIGCLSNSTISILATSSLGLARAMNMCTVVSTLPIPVSSPIQNNDKFSSDLDGDLLLTWNIPGCEDCEANGGICGYANSTSQEITCFDGQGTGSSRGMQIFKIIALAVVVPAIVCSMGISCFLCFMDRRWHQQQANRIALHLSLAAITPQPTSVPEGLDNSTIESYKKVVLGESRRLPGANDTTCPICLTDYCPHETVRCLPDCQHCFHADCIDEWLRMNGTCPVCRSSPSPARQTDPS